ncbi:MAG: TIGR02217 family protein [Alphaproteobacteria bacterium]|nr:TIGR02217 family protein [Alphaproteobacteria bacterium]
MSGFHDIAFPAALARRARGGPVDTTEIIALGAGREARLQRGAVARRRYEVAPGVLAPDEAAALAAFFVARRGRGFAFRLRDPLDQRSGGPLAPLTATDQKLGVGDGARRAFQLVKRYGDAAAAVLRPITAPVAGTTRVSLDGAELAATAFSCDAATGVVTFAAAPGAGAVVRAGFVFDTPVRFDCDRLDLAPTEDGQVRCAPFALVEVTP